MLPHIEIVSARVAALSCAVIMLQPLTAVAIGDGSQPNSQIFQSVTVGGIDYGMPLFNSLEPTIQNAYSALLGRRHHCALRASTPKAADFGGD
jgi:hypothetical protein